MTQGALVIGRSTKLPLPSKQYMRDVGWIGHHLNELVQQYPNQYVAVCRGKVVAVGDDLGEVDAAARKRCRRSGDRHILGRRRDDHPIVAVTRSRYIDSGEPARQHRRDPRKAAGAVRFDSRPPQFKLARAVGARPYFLFTGASSPLTSMRRGRTSSALASSIFSTPSLSVALIAESLTAVGRRNARWNRPL